MVLPIRIELKQIFNMRHTFLFFIQVVASLYFSFEYKHAVPIDSGFGTFIRTFTIFGAIIMIVMGFITFPDVCIGCFLKKICIIKTIVSRLLVLDVYFFVFYGLTYGCARVSGIFFTSEESRVFLSYVETSIVLLTLFFASGLIVDVVKKYIERYLRNKKIKTRIPDIPVDLKRGNVLFILVNKEIQQTIFDSFRRVDRMALDKNSHLIMPDEVRANRYIDYVCRANKIARKKVDEYIEKFKIPKKRLQKKLTDFSDDEKKILLSAVVFSDPENEEKDIVFNDFLKGASGEFEESFFKFLRFDVSNFLNRQVIYISSHMYTSASSLYKRSIDVENYRLFQLYPPMVSVR